MYHQSLFQYKQKKNLYQIPTLPRRLGHLEVACPWFSAVKIIGQLRCVMSIGIATFGLFVWKPISIRVVGCLAIKKGKGAKCTVK